MHNATTYAARRGLIAYLVLVAFLSALGEGTIIVTGRMELILAVMLVPALASVIVRLARHEGFADVSFRWTGRRSWMGIAAGILFPVAVGTIAYGLAWLLGLAEFEIPESVFGGSPLGRFLYLLFLNGTVNGLFFLIGAAGEEIGWRGYMLLLLIDGRVPKPIVMSGLIWGLWHMPLILSGLYAAGPSPLLSALVFMVGAVALGSILAQARLLTGSIWPQIVFHAFWNSIIQVVFDRVTRGPQAAIWVGESGVLVLVVLILAAVLVARGVDLRISHHASAVSEWSNS